MKRIFRGKWPQIVTELGKCFEPGLEYVLSERELLVLHSRGFLPLFEAIEEEKLVQKPASEVEAKPAKKGK